MGISVQILTNEVSNSYRLARPKFQSAMATHARERGRDPRPCAFAAAFLPRASRRLSAPPRVEAARPGVLDHSNGRGSGAFRAAVRQPRGSLPNKTAEAESAKSRFIGRET